MRTDKVEAEAMLDGLYVVRSSVAAQRLDGPDVVRCYKLLTRVERAFRSFKTIDLYVRPIRHRLADRVRAHIFLCMLAYYVLWYMLEAWRSLTFSEEDPTAKADRDPVAPAPTTEEAKRKARTKRLPDGSRVHSFHTLMDHMATIVRNTCRRKGAAEHEGTFEMDTILNEKQRTALDLLRGIQP